MLITYQGRTAYFDPETLFFRAPDAADTGARSELVLSGLDDVRGLADAEDVTRDRRVLDRLVLNVANWCNLDCVYCYAQGGDYGGDHERMTLDTGQSALLRFMELYDEISSVQFFGGEPLLNWPVIGQLCDFGWRLADKLGKPRPVWMLSTNGTVLNEKILELIATYDIKVTVSLDGPPEVTDALRPSRAGFRTSAKVEETIRALRESVDQPGQIEGTYTRVHVQNGCSVVDVLEYVGSLGVTMLHMPVNVLAAEGPHNRADPQAVLPEQLGHVGEMYADAVAYTAQSLISRPVGSFAVLSSAIDILEEIAAPTVREKPIICPAGTGTIAVDSNGVVYPCFMFYRRAQFSLGHVRSDRLPLLDIGRQTAFTAGLARSGGDHAVQSSWARRFFAGCAGSNFFKEGDHSQVGGGEVALVEGMVAAAVVTMTQLLNRPVDLAYLPLAIKILRGHMNAPAVG